VIGCKETHKNVVKKKKKLKTTFSRCLQYYFQMYLAQRNRFHDAVVFTLLPESKCVTYCFHSKKSYRRNASPACAYTRRCSAASGTKSVFIKIEVIRSDTMTPPECRLLCALCRLIVSSLLCPERAERDS